MENIDFTNKVHEKRKGSSHAGDWKHENIKLDKVIPTMKG